MPTLVDAAKLSQNPFMVANFKSIATSDELFSLLEFVPKGGESFSYTREKSIGSFGFLADNNTGDIPESTGTDELVTVPKRQAGADYYVDHFDIANQSGSINPLDRQTIKKFKVAGRTLADKFINGRNTGGFSIQAFQSGPYVDAVTAGPWMDSGRHGPGDIKYTHSGTFVQFRAPGDVTYGPAVAAASDGSYLLLSDNPNKWIYVTLDVSDATADAVRQLLFTSSSNEFDGLNVLISTGQTRSSVGAAGDQPSFAILDELIHSVKEKTVGKMAFTMHSTLIQRYESLMRAAGWGIPSMKLPGSGAEVPMYKGYPLLGNDWITKTESKGGTSTLSSIYFANFAPEVGVYMGTLGGDRFVVEADPRDVSVLGFSVMNLGPIQKGSGNKVGGRIVWYGGLALGSDLAAARAKEIITV